MSAPALQPEEPASRLRATFELVQIAEDWFRARLRREHPRWPARQIEARVNAWYQTRPGAEHGDGDGVPLTWEQWLRR